MVKILSQSGDSLADIYDAEGSIAGIETLETHDLPIVHEMGSTVFSERFSTTIRRAASGDLAQNTDINVVLTNMPVMPTRVLAIAVISDDATRVARLGVMGRDPRPAPFGMEVPLWVYDQPNFQAVNMVDEGDAAPVNYNLLMGNADQIFVPTFSGGNRQQPDMVSELALRGRTTGFGAGTVFVVGLYYVCFAFNPAVSSRGLPIPSW